MAYFFFRINKKFDEYHFWGSESLVLLNFFL